MINLESTDHFSEGYVSTVDGLKIYYKKLKPENPKKNVVIVPGFGANANQFLGMQHFFYENGFCSIIIELRGHGYSEGIPGYVENYSDYSKDIDQIINDVCEKDLNTIICGHSNGGLASTYYTINNLDKISGLILFSPWFALSVPLKWYEIILKTIALIVYPKVEVPMGKRGGDAEGCTTNEAWIKILNSDKQLYKWASAKSNDEVEKAQTMCFGNANEITQPVILIHGKGDPVTSHEASKDIFELFGSKNKMMISLDKNIHHPFLESDKVKQIYQEILNFISTF
jgi:alpha-beta hydrolase superfamily lysophospholipase